MSWFDRMRASAVTIRQKAESEAAGGFGPLIDTASFSDRGFDVLDARDALRKIEVERGPNSNADLGALSLGVRIAKADDAAVEQIVRWFGPRYPTLQYNERLARTLFAALSDEERAAAIAKTGDNTPPLDTDRPGRSMTQPVRVNVPTESVLTKSDGGMGEFDTAYQSVDRLYERMVERRKAEAEQPQMDVIASATELRGDGRTTVYKTGGNGRGFKFASEVFGEGSRRIAIRAPAGRGLDLTRIFARPA